MECKCLNLIDAKKIVRVGDKIGFGIMEYCQFAEVASISIDKYGTFPNTFIIIITDINNRVATLYYSGSLLFREQNI